MGVTLIASSDLAKRFGYKSDNAAFRAWCRSIGVTPVPGRRGWYDPKLVRMKLDEAQGIANADERPSTGASTKPEAAFDRWLAS